MKPSAAFSIYGFVLSVPKIWQSAHIAQKDHLAYGNLLLCSVLCCGRGTLRFSRNAESGLPSLPAVLINNKREILLTGSGFDSCGLWQLAFKITHLFSHSLNLLLFKSLTSAVLVFLLICIKNVLKHLVSAVKRGLGIPCASQSRHRPAVPALSGSWMKGDGWQTGTGTCSKQICQVGQKIRQCLGCCTVLWCAMEKKEIPEELQPLCSEGWVSTIEINISNLPVFCILDAQGFSLVSPSEPLPILITLQTGRLSGVYFVGYLQFLARGRTYKLVHSFAGPTEFWDPLLRDHNVLSGNTSVIYTNYQQMNCPLPSYLLWWVKPPACGHIPMQMGRICRAVIWENRNLSQTSVWNIRNSCSFSSLFTLYVWATETLKAQLCHEEKTPAALITFHAGLCSNPPLCDLVKVACLLAGLGDECRPCRFQTPPPPPLLEHTLPGRCSLWPLY